MSGLTDRIGAGIGAWRHRRDFATVRTVVLFVGYPRSGHSFIGAALNAHPEMVIAHEMDALKFVARGYGRNQLFASIVDRDQWWKRRGWEWEGWNYEIPGQWQGRWRTLRVMGDKAGGLTARQILADPTRLERLRDRFGVRLRLIHHVRNPFDTIGTMHRKGQPDISTLDDAIARYRDHCEGVRIAMEQAGDDLVTLRHEVFVADPRAAIGDLCRFLGVDAPADYLDACADRVHTSPRRSRDLVEWTPEQIQQVESIIGDYPFLERYAFVESGV